MTPRGLTPAVHVTAACLGPVARCLALLPSPSVPRGHYVRRAWDYSPADPGVRVPAGAGGGGGRTVCNFLVTRAKLTSLGAVLTHQMGVRLAVAMRLAVGARCCRLAVMLARRCTALLESVRVIKARSAAERLASRGIQHQHHWQRQRPRVQRRRGSRRPGCEHCYNSDSTVLLCTVYSDIRFSLLAWSRQEISLAVGVLKQSWRYIILCWPWYPWWKTDLGCARCSFNCLGGRSLTLWTPWARGGRGTPYLTKGLSTNVSHTRRPGHNRSPQRLSRAQRMQQRPKGGRPRRRFIITKRAGHLGRPTATRAAAAASCSQPCSGKVVALARPFLSVRPTTTAELLFCLVEFPPNDQITWYHGTENSGNRSTSPLDECHPHERSRSRHMRPLPGSPRVWRGRSLAAHPLARPTSTRDHGRIAPALLTHQQSSNYLSTASCPRRLHASRLTV